MSRRAVVLITAAAAAILAAWRRKRRNDQLWAAAIGRSVRDIEDRDAKIADLYAMFTAESAEEPW